jgi:hypothetical protein
VTSLIPSLLDDLDPDLMADLEAEVRKKQVERLPISKGEVLLRNLATRHPNLEDDIQEEHNARQFIANLGTPLASSLGGMSSPSTPIDLKNPPSNSSTGKKSRRRAASITYSPILRPASDLIFDMDDDLEITQRSSPIIKQVRPNENRDKNLWRDASGKPLKEQPPSFSSNQRFRILPDSLSANLDAQEGWCEIKPPGKGYLSVSAFSNVVAKGTL